MRDVLQTAVSGYNPQCKVVDEITLAMETKQDLPSNVVKLQGNTE